MIKFLIKGIIRDSSRSKIPILVVALGVFFTVFMLALIEGMFRDMIIMNANFSTGHVKVTTFAYSENQAQMPMDLALLNIDELTDSLGAEFPEMEWVPRINFGGLIDVPDVEGNTRSQGPATGMAVNLLGPQTKEIDRLNIASSIRQGRLPEESGEVLISDDFAQKASIRVGDEITFFGSTMYGSMTFQNFKIVGTISYGNPALDRGGLVVDIADAQAMLDMENGSTELLGYFENGSYDHSKAEDVQQQINDSQNYSSNEFAPYVQTLKDQNGLGSMIDYGEYMSSIMIGIFVFAMSIVLWNVGLLGGLRRYKEFGVRLALGESKHSLFKHLLAEGSIIGLLGSIAGTLLALCVVIPMSKHGIDISSLMEDMAMMVPSEYKTRITPQIFYIGFIPGLVATLLGQALSGLGVYKRETSQLFKELEV